MLLFYHIYFGVSIMRSWNITNPTHKCLHPLLQARRLARCEDGVEVSTSNEPWELDRTPAVTAKWANIGAWLTSS